MLGIQWNNESCHAVSTIGSENTYFKDIEGLLLNKNALRLESLSLLDMFTDFFSSEQKVISDSPVNKLLVFLNEPSSRAKKCLRLQVENEFHGAERVDVLRKVIPVLGRTEIREATGTERDGDDDKAELAQFIDDLSYLKDNFGGIGMWPVPMQRVPVEEKETAVKVPKVSPKVLKIPALVIPKKQVIPVMSDFLKQDYIDPFRDYMEYSRLGFIGELLHQTVITRIFSVCSVVCPERTLFKYFFILILAVSVVSFIAFRVSCNAHKIIIKLKWFDIGIKSITVLLLFAILGCDPEWQPRSNLILTIFGLVFVAYYFYEHFFCGYESQNEN